VGNIVREVGIWQKQSSAWFQAVTAQSVVRGNVFYNGPRAAINFNDGFGGGDEVVGNLILNMVRESKDHGPINSWDREPFVTRRGASAPEAGITPSYNEIAHNLIMNSGSTGTGATGSLWCLCHDDGSSHYHDHHNVCVGFGVKNFLGYDLIFEANLIVRPDVIGQTSAAGPAACVYFVPMWAQSYGLGMKGTPIPYHSKFDNNTCILGTDVDPYQANCALSPYDLNSTWGTSAANTFYSPNHKDIEFCGGTLKEAQQAGMETGSISLPMSKLVVREVLAHAHQLLTQGMRNGVRYPSPFHRL